MKVLNRDEFEGEEKMTSHDYYYIVYGSRGWTDTLDGGTIEELVRAGAIRLHSTYQGVHSQVCVYVSTEGKGPKG